MRNRIILTLIFLSVFCCHLAAQPKIFKPFKVDTGIEFIISTSEETGGGLGWYIAPIYNVTDRLSIGPRFGFSYAGSGSIDVGVGSVKVGASQLFSFLMVTDYYFTTERVRPFVGLGIGMYKRSEAKIETGTGIVDLSINAKTNFGIKPRIGLNVGHFKMTIDYNFTGDQIYDYIGFTLGADIGGGFQ